MTKPLNIIRTRTNIDNDSLITVPKPKKERCCCPRLFSARHPKISDAFYNLWKSGTYNYHIFDTNEIEPITQQAKPIITLTCQVSYKRDCTEHGLEKIKTLHVSLIKFKEDEQLDQYFTDWRKQSLFSNQLPAEVPGRFFNDFFDTMQSHAVAKANQFHPIVATDETPLLGN